MARAKKSETAGQPTTQTRRKRAKVSAQEPERPAPARKRGRPKGSKNEPKRAAVARVGGLPRRGGRKAAGGRGAKDLAGRIDGLIGELEALRTEVRNLDSFARAVANLRLRL